MKRRIELKLAPADAARAELVQSLLQRKAGAAAGNVRELRVIKRSLDARGRKPRVILLADVYIGEEAPPAIPVLPPLRMPLSQKPVLIVGAGPAGYFAALELLRNGIKPLVLERGKDVRARRRDLRAIQQFGRVNPHSNYCFGEGGAGTYSDGKLYTNARKRGDIRAVLSCLVEHGAQPDILIDAHPHIGSNKLPKVVQRMRESIEAFGGEIRFDCHVDDLLLDGGSISGVRVNGGEEIRGAAVILATGHSARDVFHLLHRRSIALEAKPFAMGVRIEHPQALIDEIRYGQRPREQYLPASSYKLVTQVGGRGVYSFCMCPGGLIVPAATAPGELVVNGMSMSRRDSAFANSGIVVAVETEDLTAYREHGALAGMMYQAETEQRMFSAGDGSQRAPAQGMTDFVAGRDSSRTAACSYIPGLYAAPLHQLLPRPIGDRLRSALREFGRSMHGYFTREAQLVGLESRTSSPVRIPRHSESLMHTQVQNLYPCGEGAGYAGGIVSAALDGARVANAVAQRFRH